MISSEYSTTDANGVIGFNKVSKDSDGNTVKTFIKAGIYGKLVTGYDSSGKKEICDYYVDKSAFKEGDALVKNNSNQRFIVSETISLEGVYCINQGYPVFRWVEILDQNGLLVTDAQIPLKAVLSGVGELSGFGSANPVTEDNYTQPETYSFRGRATAVIRSGYEQGSAELVIENAQLGSFRTRVPVHGTGLSGLSSLYGGAKCRI